MLNRKYFPFERNRYYYGKLLTAKDFEAEQRYMNDKRRFDHKLLSTNGIASGLGVVMADDSSIVLQSGCAYDGSGREIVVSETKVIKLSTIEGYGNLKTNIAFLEIYYHESPIEEVYSPIQENTESEDQYNKTKESYELRLVDAEQIEKVKSPLASFLQEQIIYADQDIKITLSAPKLALRDSYQIVKLSVEKISDGNGEYAVSFDLLADHMRSESGETKLHEETNNIKLAFQEKIEHEFRFVAEDYIWGSGMDAKLTLSDLTVKNDQETYGFKNEIFFVLSPISQTLREYYIDVYYQQAMDKTLSESFDEKLWLSKIDLFRQDNATIINRVSSAPYHQYVYNAQQLMHLRQLEDYYPNLTMGGKIGKQSSETAISKNPSVLEHKDRIKNTASGEFNLGLGLGYSTKEPVFSEEIMHGLGKGSVYVEVGITYLNTDEKQEVDSSEILLGDTNLFSKYGNKFEEERIYDVEKAVKILRNAAHLWLRVQPKELSGLIDLKIRWFAIKMNEVNKQVITGQREGRYIMVNPDTIVVQPKGTAHISPICINMESETCRFIMVDENGGSINNKGVYTAPSKEGVYEIRVESVEDPKIYTTVFAIVTQKKNEEK